MFGSRSNIRAFATQYSHFFFGSMMTQLLGFVTFPLLTRMLTREQYGVLGLVTTTMTYALVLAKVGLSDGIIRLFKEYDDSAEKRNIFSSTVFFRGVFFAAAAVAAYLLLLPVLFKLFNTDKAYYSCFAIMAISLFIKPLSIVVVNLMRANSKTLLLNVASFWSRVISIVASMGLLLYFSRSLAAYFAGIVLAEVITAGFYYSWFFKNYRVRLHDVSASLAKMLIVFGAPLLLTELSYNVLSFGDRYLVAWLSGAAALGVYTVGYNLALYVANTILFSLSYAIVPIYVKIYHQEGLEKTREFLARCLNIYLVAIIPVCAGFYAVSDSLFLTLASSKYQEAAVFSPLILVANLVLGMNSILNAGLFLNKKSTTIMAIMLTAGVVNIVSNLILIPAMGLMGAAMSTMIACLVAAGMTVLFSYKHLSIPLKFENVFISLLLSALMIFALHWVRMSNPVMNLSVKIILGGCIVIVGFLLLQPKFFSMVRTQVLRR